MAVKFCIFWYPTIFHQGSCPECAKKESFIADISDKSKKGKYILRVGIKNGSNQAVKNLIVDSQLKGRTFTVELKAVGKQIDGFVQYSFDTDIKYVDGSPLTDSDYRSFEEVLKRNVYFLAKQFYHVHEAKNDRDSNLLGFIKEGKSVKLNKKDNEALSEYFKSYCKIFIGYAKELSSLNRDIQGNERMLRFFEDRKRLYEHGNKIDAQELKEQQKDLDEYKNLIDEIGREIEEAQSTLPIWEDIGGAEKHKQKIARKEKIFKEGRIDIDEWQQQIACIKSGESSKSRREDKDQQKIDKKIQYQSRKIRELLCGINRVCENALIEYTYYKTLFESRYNKTFKPDVSNNPKHQDIAFNIRNAIRYVENIKFVNHNRLHIDSLDKVEKLKALQEEQKALQEESKTLLEELKALQEKLKDLQEESKALQEKAGDSINQIQHTEKKNGVVSWFSVVLALLFGGAQIAAALIDLITGAFEDSDWAFLCAGIALLVFAIIYRVRYRRIDRSKEKNS